MEIYGYAGKILFIDLSSGVVKTESLDTAMAKKYLGGQGINIRLAYDLLKPGVDPLSPENIIIVGAGALCGTSATSASKVTATTRFPLNGAIGTAAGCGFAPMLKWSGYDNVVITGAALKPAYITIFDDDVAIVDAGELWGKDIFSVTDALKTKYGGDANVICIGQAGENRLKTSLALIDKIAHLGRGGLGAVMGAKNLKAIIVRGTKGIKIADVPTYREMQASLVRSALADRNRDTWVKYGLEGIAGTWFKNGIIQVGNKRRLPDAEKMTVAFGTEAYDDLVEMHPWAGPSCVSCDKSVLCIKKGEFAGLTTTASFTAAPSLIGPLFNLTLAQAIKCHDLFQRSGIDELDGEYLIELVIELYHNGLVSREDIGFEPKADFGTITRAIEMMVKREGFWNIVADGIPAVIKAVPGAAKLAIHGKGMVPGFDGRVCLGVEAFGDAVTNPRGAQSMGLVRSPSTAVPGLKLSGFQAIAAAYQIPQPARNRIFRNGEVDIARLTPYVQDINTGYNCLGVCYRFFIGAIWNPVIAAGVYTAVTGIKLSPEEFTQAGERVWNLQKLLNIRTGFGRKDDRFPERWLSEPIKSSDGKEVYLEDYAKTHRLTASDAEKMLDSYYDERSWDIATGLPTKEKLSSLGLDDIAGDFKKNARV